MVTGRHSVVACLLAAAAGLHLWAANTHRHESCLVALGGGAALGGGGDHAEAHGHPAGAEVPVAGQSAGALFDFPLNGHEGPCDLFHPCAGEARR